MRKAFKHTLIGMLVLVPLLVLKQCTVCGDYGYFDLTSNNGVEIVEIGVGDTSKKFGVKPFPIAFKLTRPEFELTAAVVDKTGLPSLVFSARSGAEELVVRSWSVKIQRSGSPPSRGYSCVNRTERGDDLSAVFLGGKCNETPRIDIEITDRHGNLIGRELLEYTIIPNGTWCYLDTL